MTPLRSAWPLPSLLFVLTALLAAPAPGYAQSPVEQDEFSFMRSERIGGLGIGMGEKEIRKQVQETPKRSKEAMSQVDGALHQTWSYGKLGLVIDMARDDHKTPYAISSIEIKPPCAFSTSRGLHIGSRTQEVMKAYRHEVSPEDGNQDDAIVAGSIYGGLFFRIERGRVCGIFLGAGAE